MYWYIINSKNYKTSTFSFINLFIKSSAEPKLEVLFGSFHSEVESYKYLELSPLNSTFFHTLGLQEISIQGVDFSEFLKSR